MKLLVVILNYRVTDLTIDSLRSIAPEIPSVPGMKVAVLENGTGGDAEPRLRDAITTNGWGDWAELSTITPNRGFTGGNNILIRKALASADPPDYFLLLNADTLVLPGAFSALVKFMDSHPKVGVAGSRLEWPDGKPQGTPFRFHGIASEFDRGLQLGIVSRLLSPWLARMPTPPGSCEVDWVCGASMIIRRALIEKIGPLDEGLYTYYDDTDYCLNAKRAGWQTWFVPESKVIHLEGSSTGVAGAKLTRRPPYWFQARRRYFLKNYGAVYTALVDAAFMCGFALWRLRRRIQGKPDTDPPHMLVDFFRNSVFMTGFKVRVVENPAMRGS
jgi:N-acetylglucosaminyl-diphospho-decaprenol L-rhamnosyltransferase